MIKIWFFCTDVKTYEDIKSSGLSVKLVSKQFLPSYFLIQEESISGEASDSVTHRVRKVFREDVLKTRDYKYHIIEVSLNDKELFKSTHKKIVVLLLLMKNPRWVIFL